MDVAGLRERTRKWLVIIVDWGKAEVRRDGLVQSSVEVGWVVGVVVVIVGGVDGDGDEEEKRELRRVGKD